MITLNTDLIDKAKGTIPKTPSLGGYPSPEAKQGQSRAIRKAYREANKLLPEFIFKVHFNKGGIAVYGETYAKIFLKNEYATEALKANRQIPHKLDTVSDAMPVVEAYDTSMGLLVRQWNGSNSGANHYVQTLEQFVSLVKELASKPFVRF